MRSYLVRRLLAIVPTLLAVSVVIFLLLHSAPGGSMAVYANNPNVDPADLRETLERQGVRPTSRASRRAWACTTPIPFST